MVYNRTIQTQKAILQVLALKKEIAQYDLPQHVNKNYTTTFRRLRNLEEQGLAKVARTVASTKKGKRKKIYKITFLGLVKVLAKQENIYKDIDKVAQIHVDFLPLVFGKWEFFEKSGLKKTIVEHIKLASITLNSAVFWALKMRNFEEIRQYEAQYKESEKERERLARKLFRDRAYMVLKRSRNNIKMIRTLAKDVPDPTREFVNIVFGLSTATAYTGMRSHIHLNIYVVKTKDFTDFLTKLHKDAEIRAYIAKELQGLLKEHEEHMKKYQDLEALWESLEEKPKEN